MSEDTTVNKKWLGIVQLLFWVVFILFPLLSGLLAYHWLPNEAPMLSDGEVLKPYKILASHQECNDGGDCGTVADVWLNTETGKTYSKQDFVSHRYAERNRMTVTWFLYGLIGCFFYAGISYYQKKDFFRHFGIAMVINIIIALYTFFTTRVNF